MKVNEIVSEIKAAADPAVLEGQSKFGINTANSLGVRIPVLRKLAKETGKNHALALDLWNTGYKDTRILASMIDEKDKVTPEQMDEWAACFDSWDLCDQCCNNLFAFTVYNYDKAMEWHTDDREFIKRAGFVMMAVIAVHDKQRPDEDFLRFIPLIEQNSEDSRNFVKKAVNWALRQIGKRNYFLNNIAVETAATLARSENKTARWIGSDAFKELTNSKLRIRLK